MSILVEPIADEPLDQGDLLEGITLCWADVDGKATFDQGLGPVISRPCVTVRRAIVQVAVVKATKLDVAKKKPPWTIYGEGCSLFETVTRNQTRSTLALCQGRQNAWLLASTS